MLVLASGSPRRRELLHTLGVDFQVVPSRVDERPARRGEDPVQYALSLARQKADEVACRQPADIVLAADTVVVIDDVILGKPVNEDDAIRMLMLLHGREHAVTTAVVVRCGGREYMGEVTATVGMRAFSADEATEYVATGEPMDKAGAYAVQGLGGRLVDEVVGCVDTVVGLPLGLTARLLASCGLPVSSRYCCCPGRAPYR